MPIDLQRKVGPLPVGVWVIVLAGGGAIGIYLRYRSAAAASTLGTGDGSSTDAVDMPNLADPSSVPQEGNPYGTAADYMGYAGGGAPLPYPTNGRLDPQLLRLLKQIKTLQAKLLAEEKKDHRKKRRHHRAAQPRVTSKARTSLPAQPKIVTVTQGAPDGSKVVASTPMAPMTGGGLGGTRLGVTTPGAHFPSGNATYGKAS